MFDLNPSGEPLAPKLSRTADLDSGHRTCHVCNRYAGLESSDASMATTTQFASLDPLPGIGAAPIENKSPFPDGAGKNAPNRPIGANDASSCSQPTNPIAPPSNSAQCSLSLEDVFSRTRRDDVHESRYASHRMALRRFKAFAGAISVLDISDACARAFVENLRSRKLSEATVLRQLLVLSSVVRRGQRAGLLPETPSDPFRRPWSCLWPQHPHLSATQTFSIDELQQLVSLAARRALRARRRPQCFEVRGPLDAAALPVHRNSDSGAVVSGRFGCCPRIGLLGPSNIVETGIHAERLRNPIRSAAPRVADVRFPGICRAPGGRRLNGSWSVRCIPNCVPVPSLAQCANASFDSLAQAMSRSSGEGSRP